MSVSYLIDTDWIIDHFNKIEKVTKKLEELIIKDIVIYLTVFV